MAIKKLTVFQLSYIICISAIFINCADPPYPFKIGNVSVSAFCTECIPVDDSLSVKIAIEGVEFVDSILTIFGSESITIQRSMLQNFWVDTVKRNFACRKTGNHWFRYSYFMNNQTVFHDSLSFNIQGEPARFTRQPVTTTVDEWTSLQLITKVVGCDTIHYKWYKGDTLLNTFNGDTLHIDTARVHDSGIYFCIINNKWGVPDTSAPIAVTINRVNRKPVLLFDSTLYRVQEANSVCAIIMAKDPNGDPIKFNVLNSDSLDAAGVNCTYRQEGDSILLMLKADWIKGYSPRSIQLYVAVNDGALSDTAKLRLSVADSLFPPVWKNDSVTFSVPSGKECSIQLLTLLKETDSPVDFYLSESLPDHDRIGPDGTTYLLPAVYAFPGKYNVKIIASDPSGIVDTVKIDLVIE